MDLGTTYVAAARWDCSGVEMVTLGDRSVVMPSAVYLAEDGSVVVGEVAERRAVNDPGQVARQFKRRLGDPIPVRLGQGSFPATELLAMVLRDVLARVTQAEGVPPERVVLTHPANWGPFRRGVFAEVPRLAELSAPMTITEPEAAALHYAAAQRLATGATVAVYDLGGGTFDATVVRKEPGGPRVLGTPEGVERLGGIDFDQAVFDYVRHSAGNAMDELDPHDRKTRIALARLRQDCVLAKESLSVDREVVIPVFLPQDQFEVRLTQEKFDELIRAHVESTITALSRALRSAEVTPSDLDAVLLVGGSSRIPLVATMVSQELGRPVVVDTHPKYAVALGAAQLTGHPANGTTGSSTLSPTPTAATSSGPTAPTPPGPTAPTPPGSTAPTRPTTAPTTTPTPWVPPLREHPKRRRQFFTGHRRSLISVVVLVAVLGLGGYYFAGHAADTVVFLRTDQPGEHAFGPNLVASASITPTLGLDPDAREDPTGNHDGLYFDAPGSPSCKRDALDALLRTDHELAGAWGGVFGTDATAAPLYLAALTPARLRADTRVTEYSYASGQAQAHPVILQAGTAVLINDRGEPAIDCANSDPLTRPTAPVGLESEDVPEPAPAWPGFNPRTTIEVGPADTVVREFGLVDAAGGTPFRRPAGTDGALDIAQLPTTGRLEGRYLFTGIMTRCRGFVSCQSDNSATFSMDATFDGCPRSCVMLTTGIQKSPGGDHRWSRDMTPGLLLARAADAWRTDLRIVVRCVRLSNGARIDIGPHNGTGLLAVTVTRSAVVAGIWKATETKVDHETSAPPLRACEALDRAFSLTGIAQ